MKHWADVLRIQPSVIFKPVGFGVTCSGCGEQRIVRSGDMLCIGCWEAAGCPAGNPEPWPFDDWRPK